MLRIAPALSTRPNVDDPTTVESPEKFGVLVRFVTFQARSTRRRPSRPYWMPRFTLKFVVMLPGPIMVLRGASPMQVPTGVVNAAC